MHCRRAERGEAVCLLVLRRYAETDYVRHRTRALMLLPLCANMGMLIGPLVGGLLSSQSGHWFFRSYPYAVPNIVVAIMYALAASGVFFALEETLESKRHDKRSLIDIAREKALTLMSRNRQHAYSLLPAEDPPDSRTTSLELGAEARAPAATKALPASKSNKFQFKQIWTSQVMCTMLAHFIITGHLGTFSTLWAMFLSTPPGEAHEQHPPIRFNGGLGLEPRDIGLVMSFLGIIALMLQVSVYPTLNDRYGTIKIWRAALFIFPIVYVLAPFPSLAASPATIRSGSLLLVWLAMVPVLLLFVLGRTGVTPATTLLINDCTPHPSVRATIHTTGTVVGNLSRSIFPILALGIYGEGLRIGVVGLGFWSLALLAILACSASMWVTGAPQETPGTAARDQDRSRLR